MLILSFNVGNERYGIDAISVLEVVPLIELKKVPLIEKTIKGLFNYRGTPTPVIDLCQLFEQHNCRENLSTRIIIIEYKSKNGSLHPLGFTAERVTDVIKCKEKDITTTGIKAPGKSFLGKIYKHNNDLIQLVDIHKVLPETISQQLIFELS